MATGRQRETDMYTQRETDTERQTATETERHTERVNSELCCKIPTQQALVIYEETV